MLNVNFEAMDTERKIDRVLTEYNFDRMSFDEAKQELLNLRNKSIENKDKEVLTKREQIASQAMQGYIVQRHAQNENDMKQIAKWSVRMADELLKALDNK